jgi:putative nucleotidyltransferase with HDIG domain
MVLNQTAVSLDHDARLKMELIYNLSHEISSASPQTLLLDQIIRLTQKTLNSSAASILLFKDNEQELFFEAASGPVGKILKSVKVDAENSIAGQVVRTRKPVVVNNVKDNRNFHGITDENTGFVTNSLICVPLVMQNKTIGVLEVINKLDGGGFNESDIDTLVPVATTSAMAIENARLHQTILEAYKNTLTTLVGVIDAKDAYTHGHSQRVMQLTLMAASELSLSPEQMDTLEYAGILHDIGKVAVDNQVLNKTGRLDEEEWAVIKAHPATGDNILKKMPFLQKARPGVRHHHEKFDGSGYPDGLKGTAIPFEARLIAVADAFDAMTTNRAYREAFTINHSLNELKRCAVTHFCPVAVEAFLAGFSKQQAALDQAGTLTRS